MLILSTEAKFPAANATAIRRRSAEGENMLCRSENSLECPKGITLLFFISSLHLVPSFSLSYSLKRRYESAERCLGGNFYSQHFQFQFKISKMNSSSLIVFLTPSPPSLPLSHLLFCGAISKLSGF